MGGRSGGAAAARAAAARQRSPPLRSPQCGIGQYTIIWMRNVRAWARDRSPAPRPVIGEHERRRPTPGRGPDTIRARRSRGAFSADRDCGSPLHVMRRRISPQRGRVESDSWISVTAVHATARIDQRGIASGGATTAPHRHAADSCAIRKWRNDNSPTRRSSQPQGFSPPRDRTMHERPPTRPPRALHAARTTSAESPRRVPRREGLVPRRFRFIDRRAAGTSPPYGATAEAAAVGIRGAAGSRGPVRGGAGLRVGGEGVREPVDDKRARGRRAW